MQSAKDRRNINHYLASRGLGQLNDPGLMPSMGYLVRDHTHFRQLLFAAEPHLRRDMYQALIPYLRFKAKTLGEYESEAKMEADARKLPARDPDTGNLVAYEDYIPGGKVVPLERLAEKAIQNAKDLDAKGRLELVCSRCTVAELFYAKDRLEAYGKAKKAGWTFVKDGEEEKAVCPKCSPKRLIQ